MTIDFKKLEKPYLIAEVGINMNGNLQITKKLIDSAYTSGWDCVKFQKRDPDICVPKDQKDKQKETPWGKMTYLEYKKLIEFEKLEYDYINMYCREKPIDWTASVWDLNSLNFLLQYKNVPFIKIPSAHLTNKELLSGCCNKGLSILISVGMSSIEEIDDAVSILQDTNENFALLHCNSSYPAVDEELNLRCIKTLKDRYDCVIGYSGHECGIHASEVAVSLGAMIIEKHITMGRFMWGTDQSNSIEPDEIFCLKKNIDKVYKYLGDGNKCIYNSELSARKKLRGY